MGLVGMVGLESLVGKRVTFFCNSYIYTGDLLSVDEISVELGNPAIVYETGAFDNKVWTDAQALPHNFNIMLSSVESFGILK